MGSVFRWCGTSIVKDHMWQLQYSPPPPLLSSPSALEHRIRGGGGGISIPVNTRCANSTLGPSLSSINKVQHHPFPFNKWVTPRWRHPLWPTLYTLDRDSNPKTYMGKRACSWIYRLVKLYTPVWARIAMYSLRSYARSARSTCIVCTIWSRKKPTKCLQQTINW